MSNIGIKKFELRRNQMGIGARDVNLASPIPDMVENQVYFNFHNEFHNRPMKQPIMSQKPLSIHKDPTDYHSVGNTKTLSKPAGKDIEGESMGHRRKDLSCGCGCKGVKQKHIDMRHAGGKANKPAHKKHPKHPNKMSDVGFDFHSVKPLKPSKPVGQKVMPRKTRAQKINRNRMY